MQDEVLSEPPPAQRRPGSIRTLLAVALASFALGAVLFGLVAWTAGPSLSSLLDREPAPVAPARVAVPIPVAEVTLTQRGFDLRIAAIEQRLAHIDLQAAAASGNAARAEGLLIAFAARRMVDRGTPLGFLEEQLKVRFADAQPNAVATVIAGAAKPVTLDQLTARLQAMAPALAQGPPDETGWSRVKREFSNLFVIRHDSSPSTTAKSRIDRALLFAREGRIDQAIAEVQRLPAAASAADWIAAAQRYQAVHRALDLIESTALIEPRRLNDGSGKAVDQPSPVAGPPAGI
jgi:hypothetical protein